MRIFLPIHSSQMKSKWFQGPVLTELNWTELTHMLFSKENFRLLIVRLVHWLVEYIQKRLRSHNFVRIVLSLETYKFSCTPDHTVNNHFIDDRPSFSYSVDYSSFSSFSSLYTIFNLQLSEIRSDLKDCFRFWILSNSTNTFEKDAKWIAHFFQNISA